MLCLPELPPGVRLLSDEEAEALAKQYSPVDLPPSPAQCITCGGKGEFRWWADATRTTIDTYECPCVDQWVLHRYFLNAGIGLAYQRLSWDDVEAEAGAVEKIRAYMERFEGYWRAGIGLILYKNRGTGKTLLATLLLKQVLADGFDGYFTTFNGLIETFTASWTDNDRKAWFQRRIKNAGILVLDDVGKEMKGTRLPEPLLDEMLRHRVGHCRPTIITTNEDIEGLTRGYGGSVMSLLRERSTTYRFEGADYRDKMRLRLGQEIELGLVRPVVVG